MRIGSLFSGYGGLELGVQQVLGGTVAWHSEVDPGACRVLAHRYPDVPNLGDITQIDWTQVEPVQVLTGGFPCQDVSAAGKRAGIKPGTRSGLWGEMHRAIVALQPRLVVIENVRGLLSAAAQHPAHSDLEPCPWCLGDDGPVPLRALGAVLGDLADSGFHARWTGLRAADVGAPHGRFRVFVVAWPAADAADHDSDRGAAAGASGRRTGVAAADADRGRPRHVEPRAHRVPVADQDGDNATAADAERGGRDGRAGAPGQSRRLQPADRGDVAADAEGHGQQERRSVELETAQSGEHEGRPDVEGCAPLEGASASQAGVRGLHGDDKPARPSRRPGSHEQRSVESADSLLVVPPEVALAGGPGEAPGRRSEGGGDCGCPLWGQYAPAIHRWEMALGRVAPAPTSLSPKGTHRLSARAVEFLMGLPDGWVCDVPDLTRNAQLKALGNGVVPQQAAAALRLLLDVAAPPASCETEGAA